MADDLVVSLKDVSFSYQGGTKPVLNRVNLDIRRGEFVLVTGPSGSGKTSLARLLTGLIPHSYPGELSGRVTVLGDDVSESKVHALAQKVGFVLQNPENQLFALTVEDDVAFGPENLALPGEEIARRVDWSLSITGLQDQRHRPPFELSGGFQQRAAIAGILAMKPKLLVLDEPTSSLDSVAARNFVKFLTKLCDELQATTIVIEQRLELFYTVADRMLVIMDGSVVVDGPPVSALDRCLESKLQVNYPASYLFWRKYGRQVPGAGDRPIPDASAYVGPILAKGGGRLG
jgi:energy-coupling factor transport system ATP-binding protein